MEHRQHQQSSRTLQETSTTLAPAEVMAAAKRFFTRNTSLYATFLEKEGPTWATFRGQGGEELAVAASEGEGGTRVTASTYLFDQQVARFFASLPPVAAVTAAAGAATAPVEVA